MRRMTYRTGRTPGLASGDVARRFGVTKWSIRRWCENGWLPYYKLPSGHRRFDPAEVARLEELVFGEQPTEATP